MERERGSPWGEGGGEDAQEGGRGGEEEAEEAGDFPPSLYVPLKVHSIKTRGVNTLREELKKRGCSQCGM